MTFKGHSYASHDTPPPRGAFSETKAEDLAMRTAAEGRAASSGGLRLFGVEREVILATLSYCRGNRTQGALRLQSDLMRYANAHVPGSADAELVAALVMAALAESGWSREGR